MARLYNGWNGLAIGNAINERNRRDAENANNAWSTFANGLQRTIESNRAETEERKKKEAALEYAKSAGIDPDKAKFLAGMSPETIYQHAQGLEAEQRKRGYEAADHSRDRLELLTDEDRARAFKEIDEENARRQKIEDTEFGALNSRLMGLQAKADLGLADENTLNDINETKAQIKDWLTKHPDFTRIVFERLDKDAPKTVSKQSILRDLDSFISKDGTVDPVVLKNYVEELIRKHGIDITASNDEGVKGLYNLVYKKQKGVKGKRGSENLGSEGVKTEEDARVEYQKQLEAKRIDKFTRAVDAWSRGKGKKPELSPDDVNKLPQDLKEIYLTEN